MLRVLHYIGLLEFGGSQSFVMELYRNIDRKRIQFDFIIFPEQRGELYEEIIALGGRIFESPKYNVLNHIEYKKWWNFFLVSHPEYKVIHGHVRSVAAIYLPIARKHGCFTILHSHSTSNGKGIKGVVKSFLQLPVRFQADYYMACSEEAGIWLFGNKVVRGNRYKTIPNAVDPERFAFNRTKRDEIRKRYHIEDCLVIGHVGRFVEVKNQEFLLEVLNEAALLTRERVKLLFVGDGELRRVVENEARERGLADDVIFVGSRKNTEDYYQAMDVFALPSLWEGLGIVVIEAQASGLSCVISEAVPKEVDIKAGLICRADIGKGAKIWAEKIVRVRCDSRESHIEEVRKAGYDIRNNAGKLQRFYINAMHMAEKQN